MNNEIWLLENIHRLIIHFFYLFSTYNEFPVSVLINFIIEATSLKTIDLIVINSGHEKKKIIPYNKPIIKI